MAVDTRKHSSTNDSSDVIGMVNECWKDLNEDESTFGHVNIIIAGKTGVGKSTLINAAFRKKLAETGMGEPVTRNTQLIEIKDFPLRIYDTVGLELTEKTKQETIREIHDIIQDRIDEGDEDKKIHFMWYCVQANSDRLEQPEKDLIINVAKQIPVVLILTKSYLKNHAKEFAKVLKSYELPVKKICIVLAQNQDDEDFKMEAYGVEELLRDTMEILPEDLRKAWVNAQSSLELKNQYAMEIVNQTIAMSFGAGFVPVPVADIVMLIPIETRMMAKITNIYGLEFTRKKLQRILAIMFASMGAASAGVFLAKGLLKLIPGFGQTVGGSVNGAAAAAMTLVFGKVYIVIMEKIYTGEVSVDSLNTDFVKDIMKNVRSKKSGDIHENDEQDFKTAEECEKIVKKILSDARKNATKKNLRLAEKIISADLNFENLEDRAKLEKILNEDKIDSNFRQMMKGSFGNIEPDKSIFSKIGGLFSGFSRGK